MDSDIVLVIKGGGWIRNPHKQLSYRVIYGDGKFEYNFNSYDEAHQYFLTCAREGLDAQLLKVITTTEEELISRC